MSGGGEAKRQGPRRGKGAALNARITLDTREALLREAERSGRSMSEVAEDWLAAARDGYAATDGLACSEGLRRMIRFAQNVEDTLGDPVSDRTAHATLAAGLQHLARNILPPPTMPARDEAYLRVALVDLRALLAKLEELTGDSGLEAGLQNLRARPSALLLRLIRGRLQVLSQSEDLEIAASAQEAAIFASAILQATPAASARDLQETGRVLALSLLGEEVGPDEALPRGDPEEE